jgi:hypothetical protein
MCSFEAAQPREFGFVGVSAILVAAVHGSFAIAATERSASFTIPGICWLAGSVSIFGTHRSVAAPKADDISKR